MLSFLALAGRGSWQTFERAAQELTGRKGSYHCARALCSHGLLEFDWLGDRSWAIPPLSIIRVDQDRFFAIGLLDADASASLRGAGFVVEFRATRISSEMTYTRAEILDHDQLGVAGIERLLDFCVEPTSVDAGRVLLSSLPQIGATIDSRPIMTLESAVRGGEVRFLNSTLSFADEPQDTEEAVAFEIVRVRPHFAPAEYYYVDTKGARRIELELALSYSAARLGLKFIHHSADVLAIKYQVPLPVLFQRAIHFSGGTFIGPRRVADNGHWYYCFKGVSPSLARTLAMKLLTTVSPLPDLEDLP